MTSLEVLLHPVSDDLRSKRYALVMAPGGYRLSRWLYAPYLESIGCPSTEDFVRLSWIDGSHEEVVDHVESTARHTSLVVLRDLDMLEGTNLHRALEQLVEWSSQCARARGPWKRSVLLACSGLSSKRLQFRVRGWTSAASDVDYIFALNRFGVPRHLMGSYQPETSPLEPLASEIEGHLGLAHAALEGLDRGWTLGEVRERLVERMRPLAEYVRADLERRVPEAFGALEDPKGFQLESLTYSHKAMDGLLRWDLVREAEPTDFALGPKPLRVAVGAA